MALMSKLTNLRYERNIVYSCENTSSATAENWGERRREGRIEEGVMIIDGARYEPRTNGGCSLIDVM